LPHPNPSPKEKGLKKEKAYHFDGQSPLLWRGLFTLPFVLKAFMKALPFR